MTVWHEEETWNGTISIGPVTDSVVIDLSLDGGMIGFYIPNDVFAKQIVEPFLKAWTGGDPLELDSGNGQYLRVKSGATAIRVGPGFLVIHVDEKEGELVVHATDEEMVIKQTIEIGFGELAGTDEEE